MARLKALASYKDAFFSQRANTSDKWEHYFAIYDHLISQFYGEVVNYVEIGVQNGGSLEVAKKLFATGSKIVGVDIDNRCKRLETEGIADKIIIGPQSDPDVLGRIKSSVSNIDILIDDGSHNQVDMVTSFIHLFDHVTEGGIYIIEDTHTVFSADHQASFYGLNLYDFFKGLSDKLNADFINPDNRASRFKTPREDRVGELANFNGIHRQIFSIEFFNSIIAVRKKSQPEPLRIRL